MSQDDEVYLKSTRWGLSNDDGLRDLVSVAMDELPIGDDALETSTAIRAAASRV